MNFLCKENIFNPDNWYSSYKNYAGFAKSPQILSFGSFHRMYFSVCFVDDGYLKAIPYYADLSENFEAVLKVSHEPVFVSSELGNFDEHGIFPFSPFKDGEQIFSFVTGWSRRESVDIELSIGLLESNDQGKSFSRLRGVGPVMTADINEPFLVGDAFVRKYNSKYHMWYIFGDNWSYSPTGESAERRYRIAHASSDNLVHWQRESRFIVDALTDTECQA